MITLRRLLALLAGAVLLVSVACDDDGGTISVGGEVLTDIPWTVPETETYRLMQDDDVLGAAELTIEQRGSGSNLFSQSFQFPSRQITDDVEVLANSETLAPSTVKRVVNSPDGERSWDAEYHQNEVTVLQRFEDDERTDTIDVPATSYDTWTDLFLWRTIEFREDSEVRYQAVVTADFAQPDVITIVIEVTGLETVTVPAGTFETWRMEIRSGGRTQRAWIANDDERTLVRYDNTQLVFELDS